MEPLTAFRRSVTKSDEKHEADSSSIWAVAIYSLEISNLHELILHGSTENGSKLFSSNRLQDSHVLAIVKALKIANISLRTLSLTNHRITDIGFESICSSIANRNEVLHLDLSQNSIHGENMSALQLSNASCPLLSFNLSYNPLCRTAGMVIANDLRTNHKLLTLEASNCGLSLSAIIAIATTLKQNSVLRTLKVDRPLVDMMTHQEEGVDHISRLLTSRISRIEKLTLRYHCIAEFGASLLATAIRGNASLTHLDLERNKIGPAGCEALASCLIIRSTGPLNTLLLSHNRVGNEGAKALSEVFKICITIYVLVVPFMFILFVFESTPAIRTIRITFTYDTAISRSKALSYNKNILRLSLKSNGIGESGLVAICSSITRNKTLKNVSLFGNAFSHLACERFHSLNFERSNEAPDISPEYIWSAVELDICPYEVDGVFLVAEKEEIFA